MNVITLVGRLTRDPELRFLPDGKPVANFSVAVDRPFKNQQGEREADFIDVVFWGTRGEKVAELFSKGKPIAVTGRLQIRSYETQGGQRRKAAEVIGNDWRFVPGDKGGGSNPNFNEGADVPW